MAVPKKRKTSRASKEHRAGAYKPPVLVIASCQNCKSPVVPHRVCLVCGYYGKKKVFEPKSKVKRKKKSEDKKDE